MNAWQLLQEPVPPVMDNRNQEQDLAKKVLRRAEISRLTRNLKSRLALASARSVRHSQSPRRAFSQTALGPPAVVTPPSPVPLTSDLRPSYPPGRKRARTLDAGYARATQSLPNIMGSPLNEQSFTFPPVRRRMPTSYSMSHLGPSEEEPLGQQIEQIEQLEQTRQQQSREEPPMEPPSTPPASRATLSVPPGDPQTPRRNTPGRPRDGRDGASLLLYLATSPGRNPPHTPRTPDFNFNEFLNVFTPSPGLACARQRLTFD